MALHDKQIFELDRRYAKLNVEDTPLGVRTLADLMAEQLTSQQGLMWIADDFFLAVEHMFLVHQVTFTTPFEAARRAWVKLHSEEPLLSARAVPTQTATETAEKPVRWFFHRLIPTASLTFLAGEASSGKSTLVSKWLAESTLGKLEGEYMDQQSNLLWISGEEDIERYVKPRFRLYGADMNRIHFTKPEPWQPKMRSPYRITLPEGLEVLAATIEATKARVVLFDPLTHYFSDGLNENFQPHVREALEPTMHMCADLGVTIIGLAHFGKNTYGKRTIMGSSALEAVVRNVLVTHLDPLSEQRFFGSHKANNVAERHTFIFEMHSTKTEGVAIAIDSGIDRRSIDKVIEDGDRAKFRRDEETIPDPVMTPAEKIVRALEDVEALPWAVVHERTALALATFKRHLKTLVDDGVVLSYADPTNHKVRWLAQPHVTEELFQERHQQYTDLQALKS